MKRTLLILLLVTICGAPLAAQSIAVRGETVYTMQGDPIENGVVVVQDGKITAVGTADEVKIPAGFEVLEAAVVTPGLVDAHSVVGLAGYLNSRHDQDQIEKSSPIQPELRAIDAYNAREPLVEWIRGFGVTTLHTGHGPGAVITGQTIIVKTHGDTVDEALFDADETVAMVAATVGSWATVDGGKSPGTRSKVISMLRSKLIAAQDYQEQTAKAAADEDGEAQPPKRDLAMETLARVLDGELPLLVTVHRHQDIAAALRVQREFGFRMILDGAAEAYEMIDEIRESGVPVIVHPTMTRAVRETENLTFENAALLADAGIPIALQSGFESYVPKTRVVLFEAALAAAHGLGFERALHSITLGAAELLGIDDRVGSLEVGKDGDLALYDGDPFEYVTHCVGVVIEGEVVSDEVR